MEELKPRRRYRAKIFAILSLQFYRDKQGTPNFLVTANPRKDGEYAFTGVDKLIFAKEIARSELVSKEELLFLCKFFETVRKELEEK